MFHLYAIKIPKSENLYDLYAKYSEIGILAELWAGMTKKQEETDGYGVRRMILISECLAGVPCRMDGKSKLIPEIKELADSGQAVCACPEVLGGLPTPREPSERCGNRVINRAGDDVTEAFQKGAEEALRIYREHNCTMAVLKSKSPSCGIGMIHNGLFDGGLVSGNGVCAQLFLDEGIEVITEQEYLRRNAEEKA